MNFHYTYRITNILIKKHYYGTRTSLIEPKKDIGIYYFSSSSDEEFLLDQKNNPQNYKYKVIKSFNSRKMAIELEIKLHNKFEVGLNEKFYNKVKQTSTGFDNTGVTYSDEINASKGRTGSENGFFDKTHSEETKLRLSEINKNKVNVFDENNNQIRVDKNNQKYLDGTYTSLNSVIGKSEEFRKKLSENHADFSECNHPGAKIIHIFDNKNILRFTCNGNFAKICELNNLPYKALNVSFKKKTKLYQTKMGLSKAKKNGNEIYQGWYAIHLK